jgi:hypothetical protein
LLPLPLLLWWPSIMMKPLLSLICSVLNV